jgi:hypothetical protein
MPILIQIVDFISYQSQAVQSHITARSTHVTLEEVGWGGTTQVKLENLEHKLLHLVKL